MNDSARELPPRTAVLSTSPALVAKRWLVPVALIWTAYALTCFAAIATSYSLAWHITSTMHSAIAVSAVSVCAFLPQGLVAPLGGVVADRVNRKRILMVCYAVVVVLALVMALAAAAGFCSLPLILLYSAAMGVRNGFRDPAFNALMPMLVPERHLIRINMLDNLLSSASMILAPALGIFLYTSIGLQMPLIVLAVGSCLSMLTLFLVKVPTVREEGRGNSGVLKNLASGIGALVSHRGLLVLMVAFFFGLAAYEPFDSLLPLLVSTVFDGDGYAASLVTGVFGCGMLVGALCMMVLGEKASLTRAIALCAFVLGGVIAATGFLAGNMFYALVALAALAGVSSAGFAGPATTLLQKNVEPSNVGRAMGIFSSCTALAIPVGALVGGAVAQVTGIQAFLVVDGACMLLVAGLAIFSKSFRSLRS